MSFILTHGAYTPAASIAFGLWGAVMMLCAVMAFVHARAKRFDRHRAWAIRLFAMVLGSWVFDLEIRAWKDLTGGLGMGAGDTNGPFDYAILYLLLRAQPAGGGVLHPQPAPAHHATALAGGVFTYAVVMVTATSTGKYGKHLLQALGGG